MVTTLKLQRYHNVIITSERSIDVETTLKRLPASRMCRGASSWVFDCKKKELLEILNKKR